MVLNAFGVRANSKVVIGLPGYPWDVGEVFAFASEECGAEVWCMGSAFDHPALLGEWLRDVPDFIIAPVGRMFKIPRREMRKTKFIVVGEAINSNLENRLRSEFGFCEVWRIYGHSELGTLAYQISRDPILFRTNPRFRMSISAEEHLLVSGGEFKLSPLDTFDCAELLPPMTGEGQLWQESPILRLISRADKRHPLRFARLSEKDIESFRIAIDADFVQLRFLSAESLAEIEVHIVKAALPSIKFLQRRFSECVLEAFDESNHLDCAMCVHFVHSSMEDLEVTPRGKAPLVLIPPMNFE